jgi:DNA-damage-inducible protein J
MPANALVQARIDKKIKKDATAILAEIGLTPSDAVRLLLTKVVKEGALPFEPFIPGPQTEAAMLESLNAKPGDHPSFATIEEFMEHLNAPN